MSSFVDPLLVKGGTASGARACIHDNCYDCCFETLCCPDWPGETRARAGVSPACVRVLTPDGTPVEKEDFEVIF